MSLGDKMKPLLFAILTLLLSLQTRAGRPPIDVDFIEARGNGCPEGSFSYALAPDGSALSVLFNQFTAESTSETDPRQRSVCNLVLRLRMAPGYGVGIVQADYRGFVSTNGPQSRAVFQSNWVLRENGQKVANGQTLQQIFPANTNQNFYVTSPSPTVQWMGCETRQARLILQSNITAVARNGSQSTITVDSADLTAGVKYYLSLQQCPRNGH